MDIKTARRYTVNAHTTDDGTAEVTANNTTTRADAADATETNRQDR